MPDVSEDAVSTAPIQDLKWTSAKLGLWILGAVSLLVLADMVHDTMEGASVEHLVIEFKLTILTLGGAFVFLRRWLKERETSQAALAMAEQSARTWESEARRWRTEAADVLKGLGAAIEAEFQRWGLTPAEHEVALLLLKGLSHKEIAAARDTSERTTRQQARAVYKKGKLGGRAELSAYFLEDLLAPPEPV